MTADLREELQKTLSHAYTLERELTGGGMSRVFVAEENRLGRKVVVKVLSSELAAGVSAERFEREIKLAASLQQANIVPVLSAGESSGMPYYTMPYVEGESLRARLHRGGRLGIAETLNVLRDVARALAYAHDRGVVHRDIKPDNVLLSGAAAVVTDFGIAKALAAAKRDGDTPKDLSIAALTAMGTSIGTPAYMAPEQVAGDPDVDHRADIYSFGAMAYELLSGHPPFAGRTAQRTLSAHLHEQPQPISEQRPDTPLQLAALVMRCLEKNPESRPQRAAELLEALDATTSASHQPMPPIFGGRATLGSALAFYAASFILVAVLARAAIVAIGLPDWVFPGALIVMALGLPVILFTAYVHYVARRTLTATPPTGNGPPMPRGTIATMAMKASPFVNWRRVALGGVYAVGSFIALIGVFMALRALGIGPPGSLLAAGKLNARDRVLIADFESTGDTTLGSVVAEAIRTDLSQSNVVTLVPTRAITDDLRRMQRTTNARLDLPLARDVALREGAKAIVHGDVRPLGGGFLITLHLVGADSSQELASFRETADSPRDLIAAIGKLSRSLRGKIGESLRTVNANAPLAQVTTPSLEALQKYTLGLNALEKDGDFARFRRLMQGAIAADTSFAMAYRKLAMELGNRGGQAAQVIELLEHAYAHRDRLTPLERHLTEGSYFLSGPHADGDKAIAAYEAALDIDPNNFTALNNIGVVYDRARQYEKEVPYLRRSLAADSTRIISYTNLAQSQFAIGRTAEAESTVTALRRRIPNSPEAALYPTLFSYQRGKYDSVLTSLDALRRARESDPTIREAASAGLSDVSLMTGRLAAARRYRDEYRRAQAERGVSIAPLLRAIDDAYVQLHVLENKASALRIIDSALAARPLDSIPLPDRPFRELAPLFAELDQADRMRALAAQFEERRQTIQAPGDRPQSHHIRARVAQVERRYNDAVQEFRQQVAVAICAICPMPDLGRAYDMAGQPDSAIAVFERYLATPDLVRAFSDAENRPFVYRRLGELYEQRGDRQRASEYYLKFVELWKNADPELQPKVAEIKRRLARLGDVERKP